MDTPCFECGKLASHNHHVVPKSRGGTRTVPLCEVCHGKAHDRIMTGPELIKAGIERARAAGKKMGCPKGSRLGKRQKVTPEHMVIAIRMAGEGATISAIARATGLTRTTVYTMLPRGGTP